MSSKKHKQMRREAKKSMEGREISNKSDYVESFNNKKTARNGNEFHTRTKVLKRIYKKFQKEGKIK